MNPLSHQIVDVDCVYEDGTFIIKSLPSNVPGLFTIRFTAPADLVAGNTIAIMGKDLSVRTPGMMAATSDIFKTGAVIHCDIDMDRELAFFWQDGGNGTAPGVLPNLSYDEQFAGYHDVDGEKVYTKQVDLGNLPDSPSGKQTKSIDPEIINIHKVVDLKF